MSGRRSTFYVDLCKIIFTNLPALLPLLFSIGLTQVVWVGIYGCHDLFLGTLDAIVYDIANEATAGAVLAIVSSQALASVFCYSKESIKSSTDLRSILIYFVISRAAIYDAADRLPLDEAAQLMIARAAFAVYGGFNVLIVYCSATALFYLKWLPGTAVFVLLAEAAISDWKACPPLFISTEVAPNGAAGDAADDDMFARPEGRLAAGRDYHQPREQKRNALPARRQRNENEGGEQEIQVVYEMEAKLGSPLYIYCSILVGSSMAVGAVPALLTTIGVLVGLAFTISMPAVLPTVAFSIGFGAMGHCFGCAATVAIDYVNGHFVV